MIVRIVRRPKAVQDTRVFQIVKWSCTDASSVNTLDIRVLSRY